MCNPITWGVGTVYITHTHSSINFRDFFVDFDMKYSRILKYDSTTGGFIHVKIPSDDIDKVLYIRDYMLSKNSIDNVIRRMLYNDPFLHKATFQN